jgi:hypothetical protein
LLIAVLFISSILSSTSKSPSNIHHQLHSHASHSHSIPCPLAARASHLPRASFALAYLGCEITCRPTHTYSTMLFTLSKTNVFLLLASSVLATVTAQDSSTAQHDASTSSAPPDPSPYPTATIFLPGNLHELPGGARNLAASVITAVSLIILLST